MIGGRREDDERNGIRDEIICNNYVGKKGGTDNIVGLETISLGVDSKLFYAVRDDSLCGLEKPGGLGHITPGVFQGVNDEFSFEVVHRSFQ